MLYFENDYSEGAHEKVLKNLIDTNKEQLSGYGHDTNYERAKQIINQWWNADKPDCHRCDAARV